MAKKEIRERGLGTVEKRNNSRNPYRAKVPVGQVIDENGKKHTHYETLGYFPTKQAAQDALHDYNKCPYDIASGVKTFEDLYETWFEAYTAVYQSENYRRTITATYEYCHEMDKMPLKKIGPGHIKDLMENAYVIVKTGPEQGQKRMA